MDPFVQVDASALIPLLKERLPYSAMVYNQALMYEAFKDMMRFFTLGKSIDPETWILVIVIRPDYGIDMSISAPREPQITDEIKKAFETTNLINWGESYIFSALDRNISRMFIELNYITFGNNVNLHPCYFYQIDPEETKNFDISHDDDCNLTSLDLDVGGKFIRDTWYYSKQGSLDFILKLIKENESSGVYVGEEVASGILLSSSGLMSMLYTAQNHRMKGYGGLCMKALMVKLAKRGLVPCSTVEVRNVGSKKFHDGLGLSVSHYVDWIAFNKTTFH